MHHASIHTTINVYGRAMTDSKRQAHNVLQMILQASRKEELDKKQQEGIVNVV